MNVLAKSDIVSLHLALNDATRGFLNRDHLGKTKPGVIIVNTARAGVVDETRADRAAALRPYRPLRDRRVRQGAAGADEPLLKLDNVTLTAHAGYNTPEAAMTMYRRAIDLAAKG